MEAAFLAAIREAPADRTSRLIYADWLEERGDPRGELIRIEEEMRLLPVFSDHFWQLKPRRNELRKLAASDWLQTLRYGTDCLPLFRHGVPDGWKERWRLIREFTERWHQRSLGDVGGRTEEIAEVDRHLGRTLPASVREWVAFAHDVRQSPHYIDVLRDVCEIEELNGLSAVSLVVLCERNYRWAVRHADLAQPDPPVHGFLSVYDDNPDDETDETFVPDERNPIAPTVTAFAWDYVMAYTHGAGGEFLGDVQEPAQLLRDLKAAFPVQSNFDGMQIFEDDNIIVRLSTSIWSQDPQFCVKVAKPLPAEAIPAFLWDCTRNGGAFRGIFISDERSN